MHLKLNGMNLQSFAKDIAAKVFFSSSVVCLHMANNNINDEDKLSISSTFSVTQKYKPLKEWTLDQSHDQSSLKDKFNTLDFRKIKKHLYHLDFQALVDSFEPSPDQSAQDFVDQINQIIMLNCVDQRAALHQRFRNSEYEDPVEQANTVHERPKREPAF